MKRITKPLGDLIAETYRAALINKSNRNLQRVLLASNLAERLFDAGFSPEEADCVNEAIDSCVELKAPALILFSVLGALGFEVER